MTFSPPHLQTIWDIRCHYQLFSHSHSQQIGLQNIWGIRGKNGEENKQMNACCLLFPYKTSTIFFSILAKVYLAAQTIA